MLLRRAVNYQAPYTDATLPDTHMASADAPLCLCLKITTADGATTKALTTHDSNLTLPGHPGVTFLADPGFDCSEFETGAGEVSNISFEIPFHASAVTKAARLAGLYSHATLDLMVVNQEATGMGQLLFRFKAGAGRVVGPKLVLEGRGLNACAQANILALTSPTCRNDLGVNSGRSRCQVTLANYTRPAVAVSHTPTNRSTFRLLSITAPTVAYKDGKVRFTTGANAGITREIKSYDAATKEFVTKQAFPYEIAILDQAVVSEGCDKTIETCALFAVAGNPTGTAVEDFAGEPLTPLPERANKVPPVN